MPCDRHWQIDFNFVELSGPSDSLQLYDGEDITAPLLQSFTAANNSMMAADGSRVVFSVLAQSPKLLLVFTSGQWPGTGHQQFSTGGYRANVYGGRLQDCPPQLPLQQIGSLGIGPYRPNLRCTWLTYSDATYSRMALALQSVSLGPGDSLQVYDGSSTAGE